MTRSQVRYLLGTPMVPDLFDKDRWDYLYYFQARPAGAGPSSGTSWCIFKEDKVTEYIQRDNVPESAPEGPEQGAPIQKFPKI